MLASLAGGTTFFTRVSTSSSLRRIERPCHHQHTQRPLSSEPSTVWSGLRSLHVSADHGEHFAWPARSVSLYRWHPHNGEVNRGVPGESGRCSRTAERNRATTQAWQVCIFVVYCGISWLQDHGTRSPTNTGQGQSSAKCSRTTRCVTVEVVNWSSQLLRQISARFIQCSCSPLQVIPEGNEVGLGRWAAESFWRGEEATHLWVPIGPLWPKQGVAPGMRCVTLWTRCCAFPLQWRWPGATDCLRFQNTSTSWEKLVSAGEGSSSNSVCSQPLPLWSTLCYPIWPQAFAAHL